MSRLPDCAGFIQPPRLQMFSVEIKTDPHRHDLLIAELWELGCAGITEHDDGRVRAFFEDSAERELLKSRFAGAIIRTEDERDWIATARELLQPMLVGARFFLVPEWRTDPTPSGYLRIEISPGLAFGTGIHETTQLCLEALEELVRPGITVLDVGTGSGILAEAAALLGASRVFACDTDPEAVDIARKRVPASFIGSANGVRRAAADLTVANISLEAVVQLAPDLLRTLRPGGVLLATGFEVEELDQVQAAFKRVTEVRQKGNWMLVLVTWTPQQRS